MKAKSLKYDLHFKRAAGTSRGVLNKKETYFLILENEGKFGLGECALFRGLSFDDKPGYNEKLQEVCTNIESYVQEPELLSQWPSIRFGLETALKWLDSGPAFGADAFVTGAQGIRTNGLIWMGDEAFMRDQIEEKLALGYACLKMKIGAIDFKKELEILKGLRASFSSDVLELRVDANGAFSPETVEEVLNELATLEIHSIEQPIKQGQIEKMAHLCRHSPVPIALDEELIGINSFEQKRELLEQTQAQYIIIKASLLGGLAASEEWISLAESMNIGWWATSALESNVGLNAISQWISTKSIELPQGLGTGQLYLNNIPSSLELRGETLYYSPSKNWDLSCLGL